MTASSQLHPPSDLSSLHRTIRELRMSVAAVQQRYGDVAAVRRLVGDVERIELDVTELDGLTPVAPEGPVGPVHVIDDTAPDPSMWADCDDEGLGGYHR